MSWSNPKKRRNNVSQEPRQPDNAVRCNYCFASKDVFGQPDIGTLMVEDVVRISREGMPNQEIAKVIRCGNADCKKPPVIVPFKGFTAHGIELGHLCRLVASCRGVPTFTVEELRSGQLRQHPVPAKVEEVLAEKPRPEFGKPYNPDQHIEPRQQELAAEARV